MRTGIGKGKRVLLWLGLAGMTAYGQAQIDGVIDIHAHSAPDSTPRSIDAITSRILPRRATRIAAACNRRCRVARSSARRIAEGSRIGRDFWM